MWVMYITLFFVPLIFVFGQDSFDCESKEKCKDCIQEIDCIWCITPNNQTEGRAPIHCVHKNNVPTDWCKPSLIITPQQSLEILENAPFTSDTTKQIQLRPQHIKLSLRKGEKVDVHFQYKQAENYPVDLYYIMDLSASMENHREKLGQLGVKLAEALKNITSNVKLGFGSFIDKVDLPFVSTVPAKLKEPCKIGSRRCVPPYSFKNHLNMTEDYQQFKKEVTDSRVSGNLDAPEGGLDAIMQAIVCKQIGWRSKARHLLVFSTDADYHIAGDGKLAGVIEPNDATCHMFNNLYTDFLIYDYPSVSQINYIAKENNINIIFAIVRKEGSTIRESYQKLSERIENSNYGELLNNDNNNVVNLVVKNYNKIVQSVTLASNAGDEIDVKFSSSCKSPIPNGCTNVHVGEIIDFTATIQPRECLKKDKTILAIKPEALDESFIIELDVTCECPCSSSTDNTYQSNSSECSEKGDLECGVCKCLPDRFGRNCQCDSSSSMSEDTTNCKSNEQSELCSGLGECKCGKCECNKRTNKDEKIYGKFCQCNNYSCKREGGLLCSGKGNCDCGDCKCQAGYTGDACQCPDSNSTCIAPGSDLICSGYGKCVCGMCDCNPEDGHSGQYCNECTKCPAQRCEELRHCVECQAHRTGIYSEDECLIKCTTFKTIIVDKFHDENDDVKKCRVPDKVGCIIIFDYTYDENKKLIVRAEKDKLCAGPPNVLAWILGVIGTILIAGLIILIVWKVCTTIHDRREYVKFENERKGLKWHRNDNPLYKEATSTFANPVYNRSSRLSSK